MSKQSASTDVDAGGLRERLPQTPEAPGNASSQDEAQDAVRALDEHEVKRDGNEKEKEKRTYGRTPDGTGAYVKESACWQVDKRRLCAVVVYSDQARSANPLTSSRSAGMKC